MTTEIETEKTEEPPRAACPACGEHTLWVTGTLKWAATTYVCVADECDYEHTIEHP